MKAWEIMSVISRRGMEVSLQEGRIKLKAQSKDALSEMRSLIVQHKDRIIAYLHLDARMDQLYKKAVRDLYARNIPIPTCLNHLARILEIEEELEQTWISVCEGEANIQSFQEALIRWSNAYCKQF